MKLTFDHIQAKGLKDTSSFVDVQDPIIHINIGKTFLSTEKYTYSSCFYLFCQLLSYFLQPYRKNNCRTDANFDAVLTADISDQVYETNISVRATKFSSILY